MAVAKPASIEIPAATITNKTISLGNTSMAILPDQYVPLTVKFKLAHCLALETFGRAALEFGAHGALRGGLGPRGRETLLQQPELVRLPCREDAGRNLAEQRTRGRDFSMLGICESLALGVGFYL
jgi:hypothetical protein